MLHRPDHRFCLTLAMLLVSACAVAKDREEGSGRRFSVERPGSGVRGFDGPRRGRGSRGEVEATDKDRAWAREVMDRQDEDRSGYLSKSEVRRWSRMAPFDSNADERISLDELAAYSRGKPLPKRSPIAAGGDRETDGRRSQRLWTATDKLPEGLPSWFTDRDKNGDGQVAMHEYGRRWDASSLRRFAGIDSNDDGLITPDEALVAR